jgi:hypothetical protein
MDILPLLRILIQMLFKHTRLLWKSQGILNRTGEKCLKISPRKPKQEPTENPSALARG